MKRPTERPLARRDRHPTAVQGVAVARAKGHLKGKQPKLSMTQRMLLFDVQDRGEYTQTEIAELFTVSRATVYRELHRRRVAFLPTCEAHIF